MSLFDANDMKKYLEELGVVIVLSDIERDKESYFVANIKADLDKEGLSSLISRYAILVSIMERSDKIKADVQKTLIEIVVKSLKCLLRDMEDKSMENLESEEKKYFQKSAGVVFWLCHKLIQEFTFHSRNSIHNLNAEKKELMGTGDKRFGFWREGKAQIISLLAQVFKRDIYPLWNGTRALTEPKIFYMLIMHALTDTIRYGLLDITRDSTVSKPLTETLYYLIKYCHMHDEVIKTLTKHVFESEDLSKGICKILIGLRREYDLKSLTSKAMLEAFDLIQNPKYADKWDKGFAIFLLEFGTNFPGDLKDSSMPLIVKLVDVDVYGLRNAVLTILVTMLQWSMSEIKEGKKNIESLAKLRETLLKYIMSYIEDVHSVVRGKTLNLIAKLIEDGGLKINETSGIAEMAVDRLLDTNFPVRKYALNFFLTLVHAEPIIAGKTPEQLHELALKQRQFYIEQRTRVITDKTVVLRMVIREFMYELETPFMKQSILARDMPQDFDEENSALALIESLLKEERFWEACEYFYIFVNNYQGSKIFESKDNMLTYKVMRDFFYKSLDMTLDPKKEDIYEADIDELETEECEEAREFLNHMLVCESLSEIIAERVVPMTIELFRKGQAQDQAEAIDFLGRLSLIDYPFTSDFREMILDIVSEFPKETVRAILGPFSSIFFKSPECDSAFGIVQTLINLCKELGSEKRDNLEFLIEEMVITKKLHVPELKVLWEIIHLRLKGSKEEDAKVSLYILSVCGRAQRMCVEPHIDQIIEVALGDRGLKDMELAYLGILTISSALSKQVDTEDDIVLENDHVIFSKIKEFIRYCLQPVTRDETNEFFEQVIERGISFIYSHCAEPATLVSLLVEESHDWLLNGDEFDGIGSGEDEDMEPMMLMKEELLLKMLVFGGAIVGSHSCYHSYFMLGEIKKRKIFEQLDSEKKRPQSAKKRLQRSFYELNKRRSIGGKVHFNQTETDLELQNDNQEIFERLWKNVKTSDEKVELILVGLLLNQCYPNRMQSLNELIYTALTEPRKDVRITALDFVVFLTLGDILKLRDVLPEVILCLADDDDDICAFTRFFLLNCHEKDTMLHSLIPDMVIRLSARRDINAEKYRAIIKGLMSPIKKVQETCGIIEKLLERFSLSELSRREAGDNAYCLSILSYSSEKPFRLIKDSLKHYGKYLDDKYIYSCFKIIAAQFSETALSLKRNDLQDMISDYESGLEAEQKIAVASNKNIDEDPGRELEEGDENNDEEREDLNKSRHEVEEEPEGPCEAALAKVLKKGRKKKPNLRKIIKGKRKTNKRSSESEEESSEEEEEEADLGTEEQVLEAIETDERERRGLEKLSTKERRPNASRAALSRSTRSTASKNRFVGLSDEDSGSSEGATGENESSEEEEESGDENEEEVEESEEESESDSD